MSDYGTARREFWERAYLIAYQMRPPIPGDSFETLAEYADASLGEWEKRWLVEEKETDAS